VVALNAQLAMFGPTRVASMDELKPLDSIRVGQRSAEPYATLRGSSIRQASLLLGDMKRKLATAHARRQSLGESRGGVLAIGFHQLSECCKQAGLGEAIAINSIKPGLGPSFSDISDCRTLMLAVPPRVRCRSCLSSHGLCIVGRTAVRDL
jgi:hypothetical protein